MSLVTSFLVLVSPRPVGAACNLIPQTTKTFDSVVGSTNRPYAAPNEPIEIRIRPCDTGSTEPTGFANPPSNYRVTVLFTPRAAARHAVVLSNDCSFFTPAIKSACETQLGSGGAECMQVLAGPGRDIDVVTRDAEQRLSVRFPNTDAGVGVLGDNLTLAGPASIVVTRASDALPCDVAASGCRGRTGLVACIDNYFTSDGGCGTLVPATPFSHFTALPVPNNYQDACFFDPSVCDAGETVIRLTTDTDGNLLLPMDWTGILVRDNGIPVPRLLSTTIDVPAVPLTVPGASFVQSYTPEGGLLPPIFEPQFSPNDPLGALRLFGTADAPYTILRLARRSVTFQQCSGGFNDAGPCNAAEDCPGACVVNSNLRCASDTDCPSGTCGAPGTCGPTVCSNDPSRLCNSDGNCPDGECGPALFAVPPAHSGFGPIVIQRFASAGICQESTLPPNVEAACGPVTPCGGGDTCVQYAITAQNPVPLDGLAASSDAFAFTMREAIDGVDRNGDGDTLDAAITLRNRSSGEGQALGAPAGCLIADVPEGRAAIEVSAPPFHFPAVAVEGDVLAFLESESAENGCDENLDADVFDAIVRVFSLRAGEVTIGPLRAVDAAPRLDGKSLALSNGRVFFRSSEAAMARRLTELASMTSGGGPNATANGISWKAAISAGGRLVAFVGQASNLVPEDANPYDDIFVRDRVAGTTERVSVATGGGDTNGISDAPSISADGQVVAFYSFASNLVSGDSNGQIDVFVRDRATGTTERVNVASGGAQASGDADSWGIPPSLSADGRYVAFHSGAPELVAGDTNGLPDVFVHDRVTGTTERVSVSSAGAEADGDSLYSSISADGRYVAFQSAADNLAGDSLGQYDIFVHDRQSGTTERASVTTLGGEPNGGSVNPSISADGRFVAFDSSASDLVPGDTNGFPDVFVYDRLLQNTERVSVGSGGVEAESSTGPFGSFMPSISADGRYVAFYSSADNLLGLGNDENTPGFDVFVHDRLMGTTERVSVATAGQESDAGSYSVRPAISADGRFVAFESDSTNFLGPERDNNGVTDVFVRGVNRADPLGVDALLFSDGQLDDTVLEVLDTTVPSPTPITLCPAGDVAVAEGKAAFLRPESSTGTSACPGGSLNATDADTDDLVVQFWPGSGSVQNLGRPATAVVLSNTYLAALVSEAADGGTIHNRDDDAIDTVVQTHPAGSGDWSNVGQAADTLAISGDLVAFTTPEAAQGNRDLNHDGDSADRVIQVYDAAAAKLSNVGQAVEELVIGTQTVTCGTGPLIAFRTSEAAQDNTDLNDDGDTADFVLQIYAPKIGLVNTHQALTLCRLEACDPRQPYKVLGDIVKFLTYEGDQGRDLNHDDDMTDLILQTFNACTRMTTVVGAVDTTGGTGSNPLDTPLESGSVVLSPGQRCMSPLAYPPSCSTDTDCWVPGARCISGGCKVALLVPPTCNCPPGSAGGSACPDCPLSTTCESDQIVATTNQAPAHDSVILPPKALTLKIPKHALGLDTNFKVKLRNADVLHIPERPGHRIRLTAQDGTCPAGTVGMPDLDRRTAGVQDNVLVAGGKLVKAVVPLHLDRMSFTTHGAQAPTRCTLVLIASTVLAGNVDPNPRNDVVAVELNVIDMDDTPSSTIHESVIASAKLVKLSIGASTTKTKTVKVKVLNADAETDAGHPIVVTARDGDCPAGTLGTLTPASVTLAGGAKASVAVPITVHSAGFTSLNKKSPGRCTAVLTATTDVGGNLEPDASNNTTNLVIEVIDKNDF